MRGDQSAGRHKGTADDAGHRRGDGGVLQVDARRLHALAGRFHSGFGVLPGGLGIVVLLAAHGPGVHYFSITLGQQPGGLGRGAGPVQLGRGIVVGGLVQGRVDFIQRLPGLNRRAFIKQAFLNDAVDLGAHVGHGKGRHLAQQGHGEIHPLRDNFEIEHGGRGRGLALAVSGTTGREPGQGGQGQNDKRTEV